MPTDFNGTSQGDQGLPPSGTTPPSDNPSGQPTGQPVPPTAPVPGQAATPSSASAPNWQDSPEYRQQQAQRDREIAEAKRREQQANARLAALEQQARRRDEVYRSSLPEDQREAYDREALASERQRLEQERAEFEFNRQFAPIQERAQQVLGPQAQGIDWSNPMNAITQVLDAVPQVGQMGYQPGQQAAPLNPTAGYAAPQQQQGGYPQQQAGGYPPQQNDQMYQTVMGMVRDAMQQVGANSVDLGGGASAPRYQDMNSWQQEYDRLRQVGDREGTIRHLAFKPQT